MKVEYFITVILILTLFLVSAIWYYDNKVDNLENRLENIPKDTIKVYIKGIPDTVKIVDTVKIKIRIPIITGTQIDTTINKDEHEITLAATESFLDINIKCNKPEITITRIDTVKIKEITYIEKPIIDTDVHWSELAYGFIAGTLVTAITIIALK